MTAWPEDLDGVFAGDLTVATGYLTPAGGVVVTGVAPCGLADRDAGTVGFTTSLGFGKKLERIVRGPQIAVAYHAREHGRSSDPRCVLVQGTATVDLTPSRVRLEAFAPQVEPYVGEVKRGPLWDRVLREYYTDRLFVDIAVERITAWPDLGAAGEPVVHGRPSGDPPAPQSPPKNGTGPRVDVERTSRQMSGLPHRLLGFRGGDGFPVVVPVDLGGHDRTGLRLVVPPGLLPPGGRRAGFLAHAFKPKLVGLSTRQLTGWLEVGDDGRAVYAPHTSKGFTAPPNKPMLLVLNGMLAKVNFRKATNDGLLGRLETIQSEMRR